MAENGDMPAHSGTYTSFLTLLKWGAIGSAAVTAFVIFLLVS